MKWKLFVVMEMAQDIFLSYMYLFVRLMCCNLILNFQHHCSSLVQLNALLNFRLNVLMNTLIIYTSMIIVLGPVLKPQCPILVLVIGPVYYI